MCVNSLIKNTKTDIIWLQIGYSNHTISNQKLKYINVNISDYKDVYKQKKYNTNRLSKSIRFIQLDKLIRCQQYDNICLLDCDMIVVSDRFDQLFSLIHNTNKIIGVNENFKWNIDQKYMLNNQPIFDQPVTLTSFTCSVPIIFSRQTFKDLMDSYFNYFLHGTMVHNNQTFDIGDMFAYNIAVKKLNKDKDVIMLPAEMFTQTHMDGYLPWNRLSKNRYNQMVTKQGLVVYSLHGRLIDQTYRQMIFNNTVKILTQYNFPEQWINGYKKQLDSTIKMVKQEFEKYAG